MAKQFDPSQLSPNDQAAFGAWQQQLQQYVAQNRGGVPAPVTYALAHPEYLRDHPELQQAYNIVSGANLPASTREALKGYHPSWTGGAGMSKDSGLWNKWESWLQLGLGAAVAAPAIAGALGGAGAAGAAGAGGSAPALGGGATIASNLGAAGALSAAAPAASHGIFSSLVLPGLIKGGASAINGILGHRAAGKATDQLTAASDQAQAINQQVYSDIQGEYAPYIAGGQGAFGALTNGLGLPQQAPQQMAPQGQQAPPHGQSGGMVQLRAPNGQVKAVPQDQAQHYIGMGATPL